MTTTETCKGEGESHHNGASPAPVLLPSRPSSSSLSRSATTPAAIIPNVQIHGTSAAKPTRRRASSLPRRRFSVAISTESLFRAVEEEENGNQEDSKDNEEIRRSTEIDKNKFYGAYADIRRTKIDYGYHVCYRKERQWLHDSIIVDLLENAATATGDEHIGESKRDDNDDHDGDDDDDDSSVKIMERTTACANHERRGRASSYCSADDEGPCERKRERTCSPWFILTAGPQGAGKRYTVDCLVKTRRWPFTSLVVVDAGTFRVFPRS
jgi:hypothetical protein